MTIHRGLIKSGQPYVTQNTLPPLEYLTPGSRGGDPFTHNTGEETNTVGDKLLGTYTHETIQKCREVVDVKCQVRSIDKHKVGHSKQRGFNIGWRGCVFFHGSRMCYVQIITEWVSEGDLRRLSCPVSLIHWGGNKTWKRKVTFKRSHMFTKSGTNKFCLA